MKFRVYLTLFLLIIPFQASLLEPLSIAGIKPDLALALLYIIGLLTGPGEAALVGMGLGLLLDIGSVSLLGLAGFTRGLVGLSASLLGRKVLDLSSPTNGIFLAAFSLAEGICIALFLQLFYGSIPFFSLLAGRILPQAVYTGVLGVVLLRLMAGKNVLAALKRRAVQEEL
jgi:rod shape-determining protein MreD